MNSSRVLIRLFCLSILLASPAVGAAAAPEPSPSPTPYFSSPLNFPPGPPPTPREQITPTSPQLTSVDAAHRTISRLISREVEKFDHYFGNEKLEEDTKSASVKVRGGVELREGWDYKFKQRFHFYIPLPILERKLGAFLGTDEDKNPADDPDYFDSQGGDQSVAGLRYYLKGHKHFKTNFNVGCKLSDRPVLYVRPMMKFMFPLKRFYLEPRQYVFWYSDDGVGEETDFEVNYSLGKRWLLRSESDAVYSETSSGVDFSQNFSVQFVDFLRRGYPHFAAALEWDSYGHTWPSAKFSKHQLTLRIRHHIWRDWLRLEYGPALIWERITPDDDEYFSEYWKYARPMVFVYLEILFQEFKP